MDASEALDVASNFSDPDDDALSFIAESSDIGTATVDVSGSVLTITGVADGTATITVKASDGSLSVEDKFFVAVGTPPNAAPEVAIEIDDQQIDEVGEDILLDVADNFTDPNGDELAFTAESSDKDMATVVVSGSVLTITGEADGTATITVEASDGDLSVEDKFFVTVGAPPNAAPEVAVEIEDQQIDEVGENILLDVADNFTDPNGDELSFKAVSSTATATVVVSESTLLIVGVADGTATITVTATDPDDAEITDAFVVTVGNVPPEVTTEIDDQHIQTVGETILLNVAENFTDPNGDDLTFTAKSDDENTAKVTVINGSVLVITGVAVGTDTITVTATDTETEGSTAVDRFEVTVGNRAPKVSEEIEDQHMATAPGFMTLDVSDNFSDPDGDDLSFDAASGADGTATVSVSGSILTIIGVDDGTTTITVTADDDAATVQDMFEFTVGNRAPEVSEEIDEQTVVVGISITLDVSSYFTDADGDDLTFTASSATGAATVLVINGSSVLVITGEEVGTATITVTASDPDEAMVVAEFTVNVTAAGG